MPIDNPKYDVAISFLSKDSHTAAALNDRLSEGLNVFFFPRRQEELAGTEGLESKVAQECSDALKRVTPANKDRQ
jgi:hypothetical protein